MAEIKFSSKAHRDFFVEMMGKCRKNDTYHRAFFYVMGDCFGNKSQYQPDV